MKSFWLFYRLCCERAFPGAWNASWISSSIASIVGGSIVVFWAPFGTTMNLLVGLVPLAIFLGVMIAGPVIASFRIHQEQNEELRRQKDLTRREREELLRQFAKERQGLEEERSRLLSQLDRKKENESLRGELNGLISEGNALIQLIVNTDGVRLPHLPDYVPPDELVKQVDDWTEKARAFVAKKVPWFEGTFSSDAGLFPANLVHGKHERFSELKEKVEHRLARLAQLLTQLS